MLLDCICQTLTFACSQNGSVLFRWMHQIMLMLQTHPTVLRSLGLLYCYITVEHATEILPCHWQGLAAILVLWCNAVKMSSLIFVESEGTRTSLVSHVLNNLKLDTTQSMNFSLQLSVNYLKFLKITFEELTVDTNRAEGTVELDSDDIGKIGIVPVEILKILTYVGPRLYPEIRKPGATNSCRDSVVVSLSEILNDESVKNLANSNKIEFKEWAIRELNITEDGMNMLERQDYYSWVVQSKHHPPSCHLGRSRGDQPHSELCCMELFQVILESHGNKMVDRKVSSCYRCSTDKYGRAKQFKRAYDATTTGFLMLIQVIAQLQNNQNLNILGARYAFKFHICVCIIATTL